MTGASLLRCWMSKLLPGRMLMLIILILITALINAEEPENALLADVVDHWDSEYAAAITQDSDDAGPTVEAKAKGKNANATTKGKAKDSKGRKDIVRRGRKADSKQEGVGIFDAAIAKAQFWTSRIDSALAHLSDHSEQGLRNAEAIAAESALSFKAENIQIATRATEVDYWAARVAAAKAVLAAKAAAAVKAVTERGGINSPLWKGRSRGPKWMEQASDVAEMKKQFDNTKVRSKKYGRMAAASKKCRARGFSQGWTRLTARRAMYRGLLTPDCEATAKTVAAVKRMIVFRGTPGYPKWKIMKYCASRNKKNGKLKSWNHRESGPIVKCDKPIGTIRCPCGNRNGKTLSEIEAMQRILGQLEMFDFSRNSTKASCANTTMVDSCQIQAAWQRLMQRLMSTQAAIVMLKCWRHSCAPNKLANNTDLVDLEFGGGAMC